MKLKLACACMFLLCHSVWAVNYDGNNLLLILGQSTSSPNYKDFKTFWSLDKEGQNPAEGIKVYINPFTDKVESIIITGVKKVAETAYILIAILRKCYTRTPSCV